MTSAIQEANGKSANVGTPEMDDWRCTLVEYITNPGHLKDGKVW
jgi:hypothetical protein